ncbi:hypothetical protein HB364_17215 [Pseudoflavitalea sp. X16]|uniref:MauE/DoxX family redox-associated membrane protein n=1 Tax=Paraflavitalea devenefica TaxID=2716334 RepID=UPI00141E6EEC|nr:MauE/DoxX family redox-associated membrane protein [Paraflavitalea devenefica]NII26833.1 hypothetical protein [Paraflavitalea devenefica]
MENTIRPKAAAKMYASVFFTAICNQVSKYIKVRHLLIFLFAYTAFSKLNPITYTPPFTWEEVKLIDVTAFRDAMFKSPVLRPYVTELAYIIPVAEILICLLLLFDKTKTAGYYASLLLLTLFTGYIIYILVKYGSMLPCSCGGVITQLSWKQHLFLNAFFLLITIRALYITHKQQHGPANP